MPGPMQCLQSFPYLFHSSLQSHLLIFFLSPILRLFPLVLVETSILGLLVAASSAYTRFTAFFPLSSIHSFVILYQFVETILYVRMKFLWASMSVWSNNNIYISWEITTFECLECLKGDCFFYLLSSYPELGDQHASSSLLSQHSGLGGEYTFRVLPGVIGMIAVIE